MNNKRIKFVFTGIILSALLISCPGTTTEVDKTASYKVEHYQQNIENDDYTIVSEDTQTFEDTAGETTNAKAKTYEGFTAKSFEQKTIKADNSTVIKIYYDRKNIVYTFSASGGSWNGVKEKIVQGRFGAKVKLPENPELDLYTFSGWDYEVPQTFGSEDSEFSAKWTEIKKVSYTIEHWIQNTDGTDYDKSDYIDTKKDYPGNLTEAEARNFLGFDAESFDQLIIKDDESTIVQIRYKRQTIIYTFMVDNSEWTKIEGLYDSKITTNIEEPSKDGYTFDGWSESIPTYFGGTNKTFTAKWKIIPETLEGKELNYKVEHWLQNLDDDEYTKKEEEIKTGIYDEYTKAEAKNYPGFSASYFRQKLIEKDTVIKIEYYRNQIQYKFNATDGSWDDNVKIIDKYGKFGKTFEKPSDPVKEGYTFVWDHEIPATFGTEKYIEFKAIWTINKYNINFVTNYDISVASQTVDYNNKVTRPQDPKRQNYRIVKWYTDEALTKPYDFDTPVTKNLTLYAQWQYEGIIVSNGIMIDGVLLEKTSEVEITNQTVTVAAETPDFIDDDPEYIYHDEQFKGSFQSNNATINPFIMSKYPVTQELYKAVMQKAGSDYENEPSLCKNITTYPLVEGETLKYRPVEGVTWYDAVFFCNKLTELVEGLTNAYTIADIVTDGGHIKSATVTINNNATGYRLPTCAEWEFAARGGNVSEDEWNYLFSGNPGESNVSSNNGKNTGLDKIGWYAYNTGNEGITGETAISSGKPGFGTHEVGLKKPNSLGLYDMCGNIWEWCYEYPVNDSGNDYGYHYMRGGSWYAGAKYCSVCCIGSSSNQQKTADVGFRIVRSIY